MATPKMRRALHTCVEIICDALEEKEPPKRRRQPTPWKVDPSLTPEEIEEGKEIARRLNLRPKKF